MSIAYLYPGQGAQAVGMGKDLCEASTGAAEIFDRAETATDLELKKLCFEGPEDELARTDIAQPAIFTVSAAVQACMNELLSDEQLRAIEPTITAGLSLGEYTALYAAGAMDFEAGVKLVAERGRLMQEAATATPSAMVCVLGLDADKAQELCQSAADGQILTCANFNCPGQVVLSGQVEACKRVEETAKDFGASGAIPLKVAGAFHSKIMEPAAEKFATTLGEVQFAEPKIPVLSNVDAKPYTSASQITEKLLAQLVGPTRWQESMEYLLADGVKIYYEIGPSRVLAGLMRRINRKTKVTCVNSLETVKSASGGTQK